MVVDGVADVVLLAEAADVFAESAGFITRLLAIDHLVFERHSDNRVHADTLCKIEIRANFILLGKIHVDGAYTISCHAMVGALLLERGDIGISGLEWKVEILDA